MLVPITLPTVTLLFAAALALVNLWLAFRAGSLRMKGRAAVGDGGDPLMMARMRAHANFNEYVPIALILMTLIELVTGHATGLWVIGALLVVGRLMHPFGMERPVPNPLRMGGILLTWGTLLALIVWGIWIVLQPAPGVVYF